MADKIAYHHAYNRLKVERQKTQSEALRRFAEANPERYAELMAQAQQEVEEEFTTPPAPHTGQSIHETIEASKQATPAPWVDESIRKSYANQHDFLVLVKDRWGDEHHLFVGFPRNRAPQPGEKIKVRFGALREDGPEYTVIESDPCTCPLCTQNPFAQQSLS
jgi:hypothetical protein